MAYATLTQLKSHLGVTDASQDTYLADLLNRATSYVERYTGRSFGDSAVTVTNELHAADGNGIVWLNHLGITGITTVKGRDLAADTWTTLTADEYDWQVTGRLRLDRHWRNVSVTYTHGGTPVPADLQGAVLELAGDSYKGSTNGDIASARLGDLSLTYRSEEGSNTTSTVQSVLDAYRVRSL